MEFPFRGSAALAAGDIANKYQLRRQYRTIFPDIYLPAGLTPSLRQATTGAWLWSRGQGVVAGSAAAALHGARWVPGDIPIDLITANPRAPQGIVTHRDSLRADEVTVIAGMSVTTVVRTAFDVGRWSHHETVARLDALGNATGFSRAEVLARPAGIRTSGTCGRWNPRWTATTRARSRRRRPGCGCF